MALAISRWIKRILFTALLIAPLALPVGAIFASADREPAEKFSLNNLTGEQVTLDDFQGRVLLVNFWATWCPPCVHELPSMQALKDHFSDESFEVLALNMGERGKDIENFLKSFGTKLDFPILLNADLNVAKTWKVRAMPTSLFIDKDGNIAEVHIGPRDWNSETVQQQVASLLGE